MSSFECIRLVRRFRSICAVSEKVKSKPYCIYSIYDFVLASVERQSENLEHSIGLLFLSAWRAFVIKLSLDECLLLLLLQAPYMSGKAASSRFHGREEEKERENDCHTPIIS